MRHDTSDEGDLVLDPFAGSNTTGAVAERLKRRWLAFEIEKKYLEGSKFRFWPVVSEDDLSEDSEADEGIGEQLSFPSVWL